MTADRADRRPPARRWVGGASARAPNPSVVLAIILGSYLMIVLDGSIIITALPRIHRSLGFSRSGLSWVQNAYTLSFGGLLLLGARAGDIFGRRRVFVAGIGVFTLASLMAGLAQSVSWLLAARALQGVGAAVAAPSTLALLTIAFREGEQRTRAVAYYGAVAGGGGSVGLVLGGIVTTWVSWRWGMFINVPIGLALVWLSPHHLPETEKREGRFDVTGAITSTVGMTAVVYGFVSAASHGWGAGETTAAFTGGAALLAAFAINEHRAAQPITPLRLFASRERSGAYLARALLVSGMWGMTFYLTQFLQGVVGYSPLGAGLAFLPLSAMMFVGAALIPRFARRVGYLRLLCGGLFAAVLGMFWLSRISGSTPYFPQIALPLLLIGTGLGACFTLLTAAGIAGVAPGDAGAASGLVNVAHQLGGSLGLGILVTVFAAASRSAARHPPAGFSPRLNATHDLAVGVARALTGSAILLSLALAVAVVVIRRPASGSDLGVRESGAGPAAVHVDAGHA
jgi:EmrB/QacA subfamily drug resistance transporter